MDLLFSFFYSIRSTTLPYFGVSSSSGVSVLQYSLLHDIRLAFAACKKMAFVFYKLVYEDYRQAQMAFVGMRMSC